MNLHIDPRIIMKNLNMAAWAFLLFSDGNDDGQDTTGPTLTALPMLLCPLNIKANTSFIMEQEIVKG